VAHRTGPVDGPVRDRLPNQAQMTVAAPGPLAHRTLSGAHRTVRCPLPTIGAATRHPRIARPTVGSPDSPVNYSHVAFSVSRERRVRRGRLTGQSGAPPDGSVIFSRTPPSSLESGDFTRTSLAHRTLFGAPPDSPVCQVELELAAQSQVFFQFFSTCF
jgi:hypothetical protein